MQKLVTNTWKIMIKNKEPSYLHYWNVNNLYGWVMSQKLSVNIFEWIKDTSQFNEDFIKAYIEESDKRYFFEVMFNILKNYMIFVMIYHFYLRGWRVKKSKSL